MLLGRLELAANTCHFYGPASGKGGVFAKGKSLRIDSAKPWQPPRDADPVIRLTQSLEQFLGGGQGKIPIPSQDIHPDYY